MIESRHLYLVSSYYCMCSYYYICVLRTSGETDSRTTWVHVPDIQSQHLERTKIPDPPIHFSGTINLFTYFLDLKMNLPTTSLKPVFLNTNVFGPLSNHQTMVKPRDSRLNFYEGPITVSKFVKGTERGKLDVENRQNRDSPGSTCLSVAKVQPDCVCDSVVYIPPLLGVNGRSLFLRRNLRKQANTRVREDTPPRDDHTETNVTTYEVECVSAPVRCLLTVQYMSPVHKREKTLREFSVFARHMCLNYSLGHICVCISV